MTDLTIQLPKLENELEFRHSPFRQHKTRDKHEIDRMTMTMSVEMPDSFSIELRSLLTGLLQRDVHKRLGCRGRGAEEIKSHPFFRGIDWRVVFLQRLSPPLIPARGEVNAADAFDIGSFDDEDTKHIKLTDADQELYRNFPVVVSERWQHEIAETIFDYINHEADKAEMKRKNKHKLGYQEEEQSDCILHGYIKRLGGTFTATWLVRYVRLYPNRLELWSDSGKQPELIFMDQIEEVCNDYVQIKNEQCIVIKLYTHSKYVFTNSDEIGLKEWHVSLKAAHKESLDMMTTMAEKATKIYGTEIPLKHMGKRRQQLQQEANNNSAIANLEQKIIQKELQASSSSSKADAACNQPANPTSPDAANTPPALSNSGQRGTSTRLTSSSGSKASAEHPIHKHNRGHHQHRTHLHRHHHHHEHSALVGSSSTGQHHHHHYHHHGHHVRPQSQPQAQVQPSKLTLADLSVQAGDPRKATDESSKQTTEAETKPGTQKQTPNIDPCDKQESMRSVSSAASIVITAGKPVDTIITNKDAKRQQKLQKTDTETIAGTLIQSTDTKIEPYMRPADETKGDEEEAQNNSSNSMNSGSSSSGSCSSSEASDEVSADLELAVETEDREPSAEPQRAVEKTTEVIERAADGSGLIPNKMGLASDGKLDGKSGEMTDIGSLQHTTAEQELAPSKERMKLVVSLENVSEQQEVLRDPSKRITSDNKQREQDLVAQYEKLNVTSRASSSSIEDENA